MDNSTYIEAVSAMMNELLEGQEDLFLVNIWIKPKNNIRVYVDGDKGVSIDRLVKLNRPLYKKIEEAALFPEGDFSLEVSSPGLDEPIKLYRQYVKNTGRFVEVEKIDGSKIEGKLTEVAEPGIVVEETKGKNKKKELVPHTIPFEDIKTTKIQIKF